MKSISETNTVKKSKSLNVLSILFYLGLVVIIEKLIEYAQWTVQLVKHWDFPEEPFFSNISLLSYEPNHSVSSILIFALAYIIFYCFIFLGFIQINKVIELLSKSELFDDNLSMYFRKAGRFFLIFVIGTFLTDFFLLLFSDTSRPIFDLFSTETVVFGIIAYLLFFLSEVFTRGTQLQEENKLTI